MDADRFKMLMAAARTLPPGDYARGVVRGLRRAHHGERFGTEDEHQAWLSFDGHRAELGRGYRDGLAGRVRIDEEEADERPDATISAETLRAIIEASGLSQVEWARTVAGRDPRTVRRWLAGEPIPPTTADWIARLVQVETRAGDVVITVAR